MKYFYFPDGCTVNSTVCLPAEESAEMIVLTKYPDGSLSVFRSNVRQWELPADNDACKSLARVLQSCNRCRYLGLYDSLDELLGASELSAVKGHLEVMAYVLEAAENYEPEAV